MEEYHFNFFNILIISGVIHGFIFSSLVLLRKKFRNSNYLALTVLFLSLSNLQYWIIDTNILQNSNIHYFFIPWQWLILPMFYLYIETFIGQFNRTFIKKSFLIAPFFIVLAIHIFQVIYKFFIDSSYVIPSHFKRGIFIYLEFISFVFNISILYLIYKKIKNYEISPKLESNELRSETKWVKQLIYIGIIICVCWLIALIIAVVYDLDKAYVFYPMWIVISILVYWMGYIGLGKSQLLEERIALREQRNRELIKNEKRNDSYIEAFNKLNLDIENQKLYLNPEVNLETLSKQLNLKSNYVSQLINTNTNFNFNDYINRFRVDDAKKMFNNPEYSNYTIVAIGLEAGFNSKASFYRAFSKHEGITPTLYIKQNKSQIN